MSSDKLNQNPPVLDSAPVPVTVPASVPATDPAPVATMTPAPVPVTISESSTPSVPVMAVPSQDQQQPQQPVAVETAHTATPTTTPNATATSATATTTTQSSNANDYTGFDSVVKEDRKNRKLTFGPDSIKLSKPSNILIDIYGVISSWGFAADLKKFARENIASYVKENWNSKIVKNTVARLRDQGQIDRKAGINVPEILPDGANEEEVINSAAVSIQWQFENRHNTTKAQIDRMCADLWSQSYDNGKLKTHTYAEISDVFNYWRFEEFIKIYSYASGTVEGQRQFLRASSAGDLNRFIANGLNASGGYKFDSNKFKSVVAALREPKPHNLLYITDDPKKAKTAMQAGLRAVVVNRSNAKTGKYDPSETDGITVVNNLSDIEFVSLPGHIPDCC